MNANGEQPASTACDDHVPSAANPLVVAGLAHTYVPETLSKLSKCEFPSYSVTMRELSGML